MRRRARRWRVAAAADWAAATPRAESSFRTPCAGRACRGRRPNCRGPLDLLRPAQSSPRGETRRAIASARRRARARRSHWRAAPPAPLTHWPLARPPSNRMDRALPQRPNNMIPRRMARPRGAAPRRARGSCARPAG